MLAAVRTSIIRKEYSTQVDLRLVMATKNQIGKAQVTTLCVVPNKYTKIIIKKLSNQC